MILTNNQLNVWPVYVNREKKNIQVREETNYVEKKQSINGENSQQKKKRKQESNRELRINY